MKYVLKHVLARFTDLPTIACGYVYKLSFTVIREQIKEKKKHNWVREEEREEEREGWVIFDDNKHTDARRWGIEKHAMGGGGVVL